MSRSEKAEKMIYGILAIATFFLAWEFITTFTAARETTPGPIQVDVYKRQPDFCFFMV